MCGVDQPHGFFAPRSGGGNDGVVEPLVLAPVAELFFLGPHAHGDHWGEQGHEDAGKIHVAGKEDARSTCWYSLSWWECRSRCTKKVRITLQIEVIRSVVILSVVIRSDTSNIYFLIFLF